MTLTEAVQAIRAALDVWWEKAEVQQVNRFSAFARMDESVRESIRKAAEAMKSSTFVAASPGEESAIPPSNPLIDALERLCWLMGLCPEERAFAREAAMAPYNSVAGLMIFGDWLRDQQRETDAGTIDRLTVKDGDLLVITPPDDSTAARMQGRLALEQTVALLKTQGRTVAGLVGFHGTKLENHPKEALESLGLIRVKDHEKSLASLMAELEGQPERQTFSSGLMDVLAMVKRLKKDNESLAQKERVGEESHHEGESEEYEDQHEYFDHDLSLQGLLDPTS